MTTPYTTRYYSTVREAHAAACIDVGFDPFSRQGGWGRRTKQNLAAHGYVVDRAKSEAIQRRPSCAVCQAPVEREFDGLAWHAPTHCHAHRKFSYGCDRGHRWTATEAEDRAAGHRCPQCGEYWT
jgi:hypothetical protein